jgi:hypothetical protein
MDILYAGNRESTALQFQLVSICVQCHRKFDIFRNKYFLFISVVLYHERFKALYHSILIIMFVSLKNMKFSVIMSIVL